MPRGQKGEMLVGRINQFARRIMPAFVAMIALTGASPAFANSSATADIAAPLRAAQAAKPSPLGNGDEEFRKLFANWQSLDKPQALVQPTVQPQHRKSLVAGPVSIPSRFPIQSVRLSSSYGMRGHPVLGGRRKHNGVDLAAPTGTPIYATADGNVSKAEWFSSYGLYVSLEHGADIQTRYGHMSRLNVSAGQRVQKGDIIGYVGSTGRSTGPHLHYEVRIAGQAVNPLPYMQADEFEQAAARKALPAPHQTTPVLYVAAASQTAPVPAGK
jgi:murein DD-endopeptidase MepM/ murein hydrolase activator NlpD